MTIRKKALLTIGVALISVIFLVYFVSRFTLMDDLVRIEEFTTYQNVERALGALSNIILGLETSTAGWASWDDTYAFIEDTNNKYIQSNLLDETFVTLRLNLMMFIDSSGRVVFGKAFDLDNEEEMAIPQRMETHLTENGLLPTQPDTGSSTSGIILLDEGPMLIAAKPILTSEDRGPSRGTLIFGRYLDSTETNRLSQATLFPVTIRRVADVSTHPEFQEALLRLMVEAPIFVRSLNAQSTAGYTLIEDIYGKPVLILRLDMPRDIYRAGQVGIAYHILSILGIGLLVGAAAMLIIQKQILSRLTSLIRGIEHITRSGDTSTRLSVTGGDELAVVAGTINGMLAGLQEAEVELKERFQNEKNLRQEVEEEMNKRVEFTRALVHELKTPITPVLAASELLLEEVKDERVLELVQSIDRGASNLNRRIDELLDLAKGEINTLEIRTESIDPTQLLGEILHEATPIALRNEQSLNLELPSSLPAIQADTERFRQVVLNLLTNAFKFIPTGGKITLRAREDGANLIVEVQDNGPGISTEDQQRLFDPYHRLEGDRERLSGLGLGLALSKNLVELHGGQIWVKSTKGKGSTFGFTIPLAGSSESEGNVEQEEQS